MKSTKLKSKKEKNGLMQFAGILSKESADRLETHIRELRKRCDSEAKRRREWIVRELSGKNNNS